MENYKKIIEDIYAEVENVEDIGTVANYIPELALFDEILDIKEIDLILLCSLYPHNFNKKFSSNRFIYCL